MLGSNSQHPIVSFTYNGQDGVNTAWQDENLEFRTGVDVSGDLATHSSNLVLTIEGSNTQETDAGHYWCGLMGTYSDGQSLYMTADKLVGLA